jgi:hypothetical protein
MGVIAPIRINISNCEGVTLRWYFNGWHTYTFSKKYKLIDEVETQDTQVTEQFSMISRVEAPTSKQVKYFIEYGEEGMTGIIFEGVKGLMLAETAQIYIAGFWFEIDIERTNYKVRTNNQNSYDIVFRSEIKNGEEFISVIPDQSTVILFDEFDSFPTGWIEYTEDSATITTEEVSGDTFVVFDVTPETTSLAYIKKVFASPFFGSIKITCNATYPAGADYKIWMHSVSNNWIIKDLADGVKGEKEFQHTIIESDKVDYILIWCRKAIISELEIDIYNKISYIKIEKL